jgi:hypothetical protein
MEVLWLAILIYSVGMAIVLHYRPTLMFHENGTWKEFGYQRDSRHTIFPFWLFSIAWAFVSYAVAASVSWSGVVGTTAVAASVTENIYIPAVRKTEEEVEAELEAEEEAEEEEEPEFVPVSRRRSSKSKTVTIESGKPRPGYYVLDTAAKKSGLRKYIYYGPNPPEEE